MTSTDTSLRDALERICDDYSAVDTEMLRETLDAHPAEPVGVSDEAVRIAVRNKIADWYGAHYDADHDFFYEKDDFGVQSDEDESATDAYRGLVWTLEAASLLGTRPQPTKCANCEAETFVCGACGARLEEN